MTTDQVEEGVFLQFASEEGDQTVVIEDDGRVAYAYILEGKRISGEVWLYNVGETPASVDWQDRDAMPFQNPGDYCTAERMPRLTDDADVRCEWLDDGVRVLLDGHLVAVLAPGAKPGWCRYVKVGNRIARPLGELAKE